MKIRKGFTLMELLVSIVIICILAAMMMLSSTKAISSADANNIINNLISLKMAVRAWYSDHPELIDYTKYRKDGKTNGIVKANESDTPGFLQEKMGTNDALGIGEYLSINAPKLNPHGKDKSKEGEYLVFDYGKDRATWFVGYTFTKLEKASLIPKLKEKAASLGLHFAWPRPGEPDKLSDGSPDESTVWMKVMGDWNP